MTDQTAAHTVPLEELARRVAHATTIHAEQTKLLAAWFNAMGAHIIAIGIFAPFIGYFYGTSEFKMSLPGAAFAAAVRLAIGIVLHSLGELALTRLRP